MRRAMTRRGVRVTDEVAVDAVVVARPKSLSRQASRRQISSHRQMLLKPRHRPARSRQRRLARARPRKRRRVRNQSPSQTRNPHLPGQIRNHLKSRQLRMQTNRTLDRRASALTMNVLGNPRSSTTQRRREVSFRKKPPLRHRHRNRNRRQSPRMMAIAHRQNRPVDCYPGNRNRPPT